MKTRYLHEVGFSVKRFPKVRLEGPLIGTTRFHVGLGGGWDEFTAMKIGFGVCADMPANYPGPMTDYLFYKPALFESHAFTVADVGRTFYETAATDHANFGDIVARLTNGVDDTAFFRTFTIPNIGIGGFGYWDESFAFKDSHLTGGIDFAGRSIARIGLRVDFMELLEHWHVYEDQEYKMALLAGDLSILIEAEPL